MFGFALGEAIALVECERLSLGRVTTLPYYDPASHGPLVVPLTSACRRIAALAERDSPGTAAVYLRDPVPPDTAEWRAAVTASRDELRAVASLLRPR